MTKEQKRIRELEYWLRESELLINYQIGVMTQTHGPTHKMTEKLREMAWKLEEVRLNEMKPKCYACHGDGVCEHEDGGTVTCSECGGFGLLPNAQGEPRR